MALPAIPRTVTWFPAHNGGIEHEPAFIVIERWNECMGTDEFECPVIEVLYYEGEKECTIITS